MIIGCLTIAYQNLDSNFFEKQVLEFMIGGMVNDPIERIHHLWCTEKGNNDRRTERLIGHFGAGV